MHPLAFATFTKYFPEELLVVYWLKIYPLTKTLISLEFKIFNRWGEIVFESKNYQNDWGGTCETDLCMGNRILPEGTYFYLLDVQGITFKGYVTIKK